MYAAASPVSQGFTVIAAANFIITPEPPSEIAYRGQLAAFLLVLKSVNGFNANVTLSCSGGPAGAKCYGSAANGPCQRHHVRRIRNAVP